MSKLVHSSLDKYSSSSTFTSNRGPCIEKNTHNWYIFHQCTSTLLTSSSGQFWRHSTISWSETWFSVISLVEHHNCCLTRIPHQPECYLAQTHGSLFSAVKIELERSCGADRDGCHFRPSVAKTSDFFFFFGCLHRPRDMLSKIMRTLELSSCSSRYLAAVVRCLFFLAGRVSPLTGSARRKRLKPIAVGIGLSRIRKTSFVTSAPAQWVGMPKSKQAGAAMKGLNPRMCNEKLCNHKYVKASLN